MAHWLRLHAPEAGGLLSIPGQGTETPHATTKTQESEKVKVTQLCLILCYPMDCTVHGILQTRTLECVASLFSKGSSQPRDRTQASCIAGRFFTS